MQEIRSRDELFGLSRELLDRLTVREGSDVDGMFAKRRAEALAKATGRVDIREFRRIGRNDKCPCGSGVKFKKCCGRNLAADDNRVR